MGTEKCERPICYCVIPPGGSERKKDGEWTGEDRWEKRKRQELEKKERWRGNREGKEAAPRQITCQPLWLMLRTEQLCVCALACVCRCVSSATRHRAAAGECPRKLEVTAISPSLSVCHPPTVSPNSCHCFAHLPKLCVRARVNVCMCECECGRLFISVWTTLQV